MPAPPPRDVEPTEVEAPPPVPLVTEPARNPPAAPPSARRRPEPSPGPTAEPPKPEPPPAEPPKPADEPAEAADDAADDAGGGGGRSRARDPGVAAARERRPQPHRLPRAERRRADAVRHGEAVHPAGRRRDARRRIWCSRRTSPTRRALAAQLGGRSSVRPVRTAPSMPRLSPTGRRDTLHRRQHLASDLKERHNMWCLHA